MIICGDRLKCDCCGRFISFDPDKHDSETPFGCSSYDPPEPFDPTFFCPDCSDKLYHDYNEKFSRGYRLGCWQKSDAERRAAKDNDLIWIHDKGIYLSDGCLVHYRYVTAIEYRLAQIAEVG